MRCNAVSLARRSAATSSRVAPASAVKEEVSQPAQKCRPAMSRRMTAQVPSAAAVSRVSTSRCSVVVSKQLPRAALS